MYHNSFTQYPYLEIYIDAVWVSNKETRKSTLAYIAMLACCLVSWFLKRWITIAQSSIESEYISASETSKEVV